MNTSNLTKAQYLLRKALTLYGRDLAPSHPWVWEFDRWKELVFALLVQVSSTPESHVRQVVGHMADLDLLDIPALANICSDGKHPDLDAPLARQILEFLQENGFSQAVAERGLTTVCQAALAFHAHHGGKLQRYLRSYGELMLKDLDGIFQFSSLTQAEMRDAFAYWFQNALNMPISLVDENMRKYCESHDLTPAQLIQAADELNLNLAIVDDLTALWVNSHPKDVKTD
jgi:hypothetical protein